jgi:transcriptional regulator with PAS, ATPase and Fis domain
MVLRRIVVVSRQIEIQELARRITEEVFVADDIAEAADISATVNPHLIILDSRFESDELFCISGKTDNKSRIPALIVGADPGKSKQDNDIYYLSSAADIDRFSKIINKIQTPEHSNTVAGENEFFADDIAASVSMAGKSPATLHTLKMIRLVAESCCNPVLITGETGTGKELAAKAVHNVRHPGEQFVAVNCAALTANLLESELFGHLKGSFTGADREKTGLLELAGNGTIFLDEISEMPLDLQAKLLRVLQEKTFRKVGGVSDLPCKATIIASSNRDLRQEVNENRFRRDLYYRLNICPVTIEPRNYPDRRADIRLLAEYFIRTSTLCPAKTGKIASLTEMAMETLEKHNWPGNVRELHNVIDRAILLETTDKIGLNSILIDSQQLDESYNNRPFTSTNTANSHSKRGHQFTVQDFSLDKAERELIARALQESGWQKTKAASLLGITRATLYAKVKQHNIQKGTYIPKTLSDDTSCLDTAEAVTAA